MALEGVDALDDIVFFLAFLIDEVDRIPPLLHGLDARNFLDLGAQVADLNHEIGIFLGGGQESLLRIKEMLCDVGG